MSLRLCVCVAHMCAAHAYVCVCVCVYWSTDVASVRCILVCRLPSLGKLFLIIVVAVSLPFVRVVAPFVLVVAVVAVVAAAGVVVARVVVSVAVIVTGVLHRKALAALSPCPPCHTAERKH